MSRETRTILVLAGMALVAVVALGSMAQRYSKLLLKQGAPSGATTNTAADRMVEGFVRVRAALREELDAATFDAAGADARALTFAARLDHALAAARMSSEEYRAVRDRVRRWNRAPQYIDSAWRVTLERHRAALQACDLGAWEALDV